MNSLKVILPIFFVLSGIMTLHAQNQGDLEDIEVVIRKDKDIELPRANRNYQKVSEIPDPEIKPSSPTEFGDYSVKLSPMDPSIRINKLKSEALDKLYGNYLRAGFGNYTNTYLEGFFGNKREDKGFYNLYLGHDAYGGGPVENSNTSRNRIGVNGGLFYDDIRISAGTFYDRQFYNFYGYSSDSIRTFAEDSIGVEDEQLFNRIGLDFSISKKDPLDYLNYDLGMSFQHLNDNLDQSENWLEIDFDANYDLNVGKDITLQSRYILANYGIDTFSNTRHLFEIAPQYEMESGDFIFSAGFRASYESDTNLNGDFHLYPIGKAEYRAMDDKLIPYVGIGGGIQANGLNTFTSQNPWLDQGNILSHSNQQIEIFGGIRTQIIKNTDINLRLSYSTIDNLPLFINNPFEESKFIVLYAENASVLNLHLDAASQLSNRFELGLSFDFREYGLSDSLMAWHLPGIESHVYANYNIAKKIYMNVDIFFINGIFAYTTMERKKVLDDILDMNFQLEYRFSERFSSFLGLKNILSNQYQRYLYYENRGIQVRAGLTYSF